MGGVCINKTLIVVLTALERGTTYDTSKLISSRLTGSFFAIHNALTMSS